MPIAGIDDNDVDLDKNNNTNDSNPVTEEEVIKDVVTIANRDGFIVDENRYFKDEPMDKQLSAKFSDEELPVMDIGGYKQPVEYFKQIRDKNDILAYQDINSEKVLQEYTLITDMVLTMQAGIEVSPEYESIEFEAFIQCNLIPLVGDVVVVRNLNRRDTVFNVVSSKLATYSEIKLYKVTCKFTYTKDSNIDKWRDLFSKVSFTKTACGGNGNTMLPSPDGRRLDLSVSFIEIARFWFDLCHDNDTHTLLAPIEGSRYVDERLNEFYLSMVGVDVVPEMINLARISYNEGSINRNKSVLDVVDEMNLNLLQFIRNDFMFVNVNARYHETKLTNALHYDISYYTGLPSPDDYVYNHIIDPELDILVDIPGESLHLPNDDSDVRNIIVSPNLGEVMIDVELSWNNMEIYDGTIVSSGELNTTDVEKVNCNTYRDDVLPWRINRYTDLDKQLICAHAPVGYIFSKNFYMSYKSKLDDLTEVEIMFIDILNNEPIDTDVVVKFVREYRHWSTREQYYFLPLLMRALLVVKHGYVESS